MITTRLSDDAACSACGYPIDSATGITAEDAPNDGDISVCIACGIPEKFVSGPTGMVTESLTVEEMVEVLANETIKKMIVIIAIKKETDPDWPKGPRG